MAAMPVLAPLFAELQAGRKDADYDARVIADWAYMLADASMKRREITPENA